MATQQTNGSLSGKQGAEIDPWDIALLGSAALSMYRSSAPVQKNAEVPAVSPQQTEQSSSEPLPRAGIPRDLTEMSFSVPVSFPEPEAAVAESASVPLATPSPSLPEEVPAAAVVEVPAPAEEIPLPAELPPAPVSMQKEDVPALLVSPYPVARQSSLPARRPPAGVLALALAIPLFVLGFYAATEVKRIIAERNQGELPASMTANLADLIPVRGRE